MINKITVAPYICEIVEKLQSAGYETYIVGGAIRDLILQRIPKDYDISTSATPEDIRNVFGRRNARIIGKRFKLVHLTVGDEIIEISTFRKLPKSPGAVPKPLRRRESNVPENMIFSDNDFGSSSEDAMRRDFTVNALFFDPLERKLIDFTHQGITDMQNSVVRAIGDPKVRFEEDPVRMLRALKLIGQYGFTLEEKTAEALKENLHLITHAAQSRLSLELEKILKSPYCVDIIKVFQEYGFLRFFLPHLSRSWYSEPAKYAIDLLGKRNERIQRGLYRNSISLAMATLALPFVEEEFGGEPGELWVDDNGYRNTDIIEKVISRVFAPHSMVNLLEISAVQMLSLQPSMYSANNIGAIAQHKSFAHARELMFIQNEVVWQEKRITDIWSSVRAKRSGKSRRSFRKPR